MALYGISGVWKDANGNITHYAFHEGADSRSFKISKANAIELLETTGSTAVTWIWNYSRAMWDIGEPVEVIEGRNGKYLRSNSNNGLTDNLEHLMDFDWIELIFIDDYEKSG